MKPAFTRDQLDAVDVSKRHLDACVVAGPGSGKTTVLVEYFRRLVAAGVDPLRILAITFTEKAAGNMRTKLAEAFQDSPAIRARLERAWVSTVHGFCGRLLRENAIFAGIDPAFYVADERESWRMQQEAIASAMEELFEERPADVRALIRALSSQHFEEAVLSAYDAMRGAGVRVEDLPEFPPPAGVGLSDVAATLCELRRESTSSWTALQRQHLEEIIEGAEAIVAPQGPVEGLRAIEEFSANLQKCKKGNRAYQLVKHMREQISKLKYTLITEHYAPQRQMLLDILSRFDQIYRTQKRLAGALDFADLEEHTVRLLEDHAETRARVQAQFDHILMDEFQDTNGQQARLLKLVRRPDRFYAVGDINQSIFGFRHAEPEGFQEYRDEVAQSGRHLVELTDNFRSRPEILSAVETVLHNATGIEPRRLVAARKFDTTPPVSVELFSVPSGEAVEGRWVARRILEATGGEQPEFVFRDIAVLVRNTEVLGSFGQAFDEAGIPYVVNRGRGFYESREVNDLTHLLRVIANPRDEISMAAVLRSPLVAASDEALLRLKGMEEHNLGAALLAMDEALAAPFGDDWEKLRRFRDRLREWRVRRESVSFDRLLLEAIDDVGYRCESGARGAGNVDKFLGQARDAAARKSLDEFVEDLARLRESNPREADAPPEDSINAVQVMTAHSAKGLEFPMVFVAAMHKGIDTAQPVIAFSRRFGLGARWRNPAKREDKNDRFQDAIREERKRREEEEAHRLLYVAMTRAEKHLVLSFSGKPNNWAAVLANSLDLDVETCRDRIYTCQAPDGKPWKLRLLVTDQPPDLTRRERGAEEVTEDELLPPPEVSEQHDSNVTVTSLAVFATCPRKYYLGHYLGFGGQRTEGGAPALHSTKAADLGTQVHALLAGTDVPDPSPDAVRLASVFRQSQLGKRVTRATRAEREFDFLIDLEGIVIRGQVDLWFEEGGELSIVDYKTDMVSPMEAHQRANDYVLQLRLYAMAVERLLGRAPDRAWLYFLRPNTPVRVDLRPSLWDSPEQVIRDLIEAQNRQAFPMHEGERCRRCDFYKGLCPSQYGQ